MRRLRKLILVVLLAAGVVLAGILSTESPRGAPAQPAGSVRRSSRAAAGDILGPRRHSSLQALSKETSAADVLLAPLVVRTGSITLSVPGSALDATFNDVSALALDLGGFVQSSTSGDPDSAATTRGTRAASLTVRVPTDRFALLERRVSRLGRVRSVTVSGTDVTGESINLEARIANSKSEEVALRRLMGRAGSIPAILQVQNELFSVEGEIESLSAEEGSLLNQATYGTLSVDIFPFAVPIVRPKRAENSLVRAVRLAAHNCAAVLHAVLLGLGWGSPIFLLAGVLAAAWWVRRRIVTRRRSAAPGVP